MKKCLYVFIFCIVITVFNGISCNAFETSNENIIADKAGLNEISTDAVTSEEMSGKNQINFFGKILSFFSDALKAGSTSALQAFALIMTVVILSSIFSCFKWTTTNSSLHTAYEYVSILALSGVTFTIFISVFNYVQSTINTANIFMTGLLPVTSSLYIFGGNSTVAAASNASLLLFFSIMNAISAKFLIPFLQISFALCLASAIPGTVNLTSVSTLVKNTTTTVLAFMFSIFGFVMYLQTTIASSADNYAYRSVRFASGVFVPVIGSILGDASRTVMGSIGVIKSVVGAIGVTAILSIVIPPIVLVVLYKFALLCCAILSRTLGCERESRFLYDLNGIMNVLIALVIGISSVLIIALAIFIKIGVTI